MNLIKKIIITVALLLVPFATQGFSQTLATKELKTLADDYIVVLNKCKNNIRVDYYTSGDKYYVKLKNYFENNIDIIEKVNTLNVIQKNFDSFLEGVDINRVNKTKWYIALGDNLEFLSLGIEKIKKPFEEYIIYPTDTTIAMDTTITTKLNKITTKLSNIDQKFTDVDLKLEKVLNAKKTDEKVTGYKEIIKLLGEIENIIADNSTTTTVTRKSLDDKINGMQKETKIKEEEEDNTVESLKNIMYIKWKKINTKVVKLEEEKRRLKSL